MNIEKINLGKITAYDGQKSSHSNIAVPKYGLRMAAPLTSDCVTFEGKRSRKALQILKETLRIAEEKAAELEEESFVTVKELPAEQKGWKINKQDALRIHTKILKPQAYIKNFIHNLYDDLICSEKNPKNPILEIHDRPKSVDSIIEKSATIKVKTIEEVLNTITDLNGVKIVTRKKAGKDDMDFILDRLIPMIKTGQLELKEIEVKRPEAIKTLSPKQQEEYDYASLGMLKKLVEVQEGHWNTKNTSKENIRKVKFGKPQYTKGNYCALHMLLDLPNKEARIFEAQFMGAYVGTGKDLDDILFKLLDGKQVNKKYKPFKTLIDDLKEDNTGALERFKQYKKAALLALREREIQEAKNNKTTSKNAPLFISAAKYNLPPEYDMNNLMELKKECDGKAAIASKNLEEARKVKKEKAEAAIESEQSKHRTPLLSKETLHTLMEKFGTKRSKDANRMKKI